MKTALKILLGIVTLLGLLILFVTQRPVEVSQVVWPVVESLAIGEFVGVTDDGAPDPGLFAIAPTGASTAPVVTAARELLESLSPTQRSQATFAVDDEEWRRWANIHISTRQGVGFAEMTTAQQAAVWSLLEAGLSNKGLNLARDVTRLEEHLAELKDDHYQYGEHRYWISIMGEPSTSEPWGWQFEGHHLIINYFVLGDQVVMTPTFMGSEPVVAESGKYAGTRILQTEQELGLALVNALTPDQQRRAVVSDSKPGNNNYGELFQDNAIVPVEGLILGELQGESRTLARQLIHTVVRTPNGNDYGKDLLKQHLAFHPH